MGFRETRCRACDFQFPGHVPRGCFRPTEEPTNLNMTSRPWVNRDTYVGAYDPTKAMRYEDDRPTRLINSQKRFQSQVNFSYGGRGSP